MAVGSNTTPKRIRDKNGKGTTVHVGKAPVVSKNTARIASVQNSTEDVYVGLVFPYQFNGQDITFTVTEIRPPIVVAEAGENDLGIVSRPFQYEEVRLKSKWNTTFASKKEKVDEFWDAQPEGKTLHYDHLMGKLIRGVVTVDDKDGIKKFKPIALVGDWSDNDLPSRNHKGDITEDYFARLVREGKPLTADPDSIVEARTGKIAERYTELFGGIDKVKDLVPLSIDVPAMTAEEEKSAQREIMLEAIGKITYDSYRLSTEERVEQVKELLTKIEEL